MYSENISYFLEVPNAEQVEFPSRTKKCAIRFIYHSVFTHLFPSCLSRLENHSDRQLQHSVRPSGEITVHPHSPFKFHIHLPLSIFGIIVNDCFFFSSDDQACSSTYGEKVSINTSEVFEKKIYMLMPNAWVLHSRGRGLVVNISSATGNHPQPLLSLYSATKVRSHTLILLILHSVPMFSYCVTLISPLIFRFL